MKIVKFAFTDFNLPEKEQVIVEKNDIEEATVENADVVANDLSTFTVSEIAQKLYTEEELEAAKKSAEEVAYNRSKEELEAGYQKKLKQIVADLQNLQDSMKNLANAYDKRLEGFENTLLLLYKNIVMKLGLNSQERLLEIMQSVIQRNLLLLKESQEISFRVSKESYDVLAESIRKAAEAAGLVNFTVEKDLSIVNSELQIIWKDGGITLDAEKITNEVVQLLSNVIV